MLSLKFLRVITACVCLILTVSASEGEKEPKDEKEELCPCIEKEHCPRIYGKSAVDVREMGFLPPCSQFGTVRCCGVSIRIEQDTTRQKVDWPNLDIKTKNFDRFRDANSILPQREGDLSSASSDLAGVLTAPRRPSLKIKRKKPGTNEGGAYPDEPPTNIYPSAPASTESANNEGKIHQQLKNPVNKNILTLRRPTFPPLKGNEGPEGPRTKLQSLLNKQSGSEDDGVKITTATRPKVNILGNGRKKISSSSFTGSVVKASASGGNSPLPASTTLEIKEKFPATPLTAPIPIPNPGSSNLPKIKPLLKIRPFVPKTPTSYGNGNNEEQTTEAQIKVDTGIDVESLLQQRPKARPRRPTTRIRPSASPPLDLTSNFGGNEGEMSLTTTRPESQIIVTTQDPNLSITPEPEVELTTKRIKYIRKRIRPPSTIPLETRTEQLEITSTTSSSPIPSTTTTSEPSTTTPLPTTSEEPLTTMRVSSEVSFSESIATPPPPAPAPVSISFSSETNGNPFESEKTKNTFPVRGRITTPTAPLRSHESDAVLIYSSPSKPHSTSSSTYYKTYNSDGSKYEHDEKPHRKTTFVTPTPISPIYSGERRNKRPLPAAAADSDQDENISVFSPTTPTTGDSRRRFGIPAQFRRVHYFPAKGSKEETVEEIPVVNLPEETSGSENYDLVLDKGSRESQSYKTIVNSNSGRQRQRVRIQAAAMPQPTASVSVSESVANHVHKSYVDFNSPENQDEEETRQRPVKTRPNPPSTIENEEISWDAAANTGTGSRRIARPRKPESHVVIPVPVAVPIATHQELDSETTLVVATTRRPSGYRRIKTKPSLLLNSPKETTSSVQDTQIINNSPNAAESDPSQFVFPPFRPPTRTHSSQATATATEAELGPLDVLRTPLFSSTTTKYNNGNVNQDYFGGRSTEPNYSKQIPPTESSDIYQPTTTTTSRPFPGRRHPSFKRNYTRFATPQSFDHFEPNVNSNGGIGAAKPSNAETGLNTPRHPGFLRIPDDSTQKPILTHVRATTHSPVFLRRPEIHIEATERPVVTRVKFPEEVEDTERPTKIQGTERPIGVMQTMINIDNTGLIGKETGLNLKQGPKSILIKSPGPSMAAAVAATTTESAPAPVQHKIPENPEPIVEHVAHKPKISSSLNGRHPYHQAFVDSGVEVPTTGPHKFTTVINITGNGNIRDLEDSFGPPIPQVQAPLVTHPSQSIHEAHRSRFQSHQNQNIGEIPVRQQSFYPSPPIVELGQYHHGHGHQWSSPTIPPQHITEYHHHHAITQQILSRLRNSVRTSRATNLTLDDINWLSALVTAEENKEKEKESLGINLARSEIELDDDALEDELGFTQDDEEAIDKENEEISTPTNKTTTQNPSNLLEKETPSSSTKDEGEFKNNDGKVDSIEKVENSSSKNSSVESPNPKESVKGDFRAPKMIPGGFFPLLPYSEQDPGPLLVTAKSLNLNPQQQHKGIPQSARASREMKFAP